MILAYIVFGFAVIVGGVLLYRLQEFLDDLFISDREYSELNRRIYMSTLATSWASCLATYILFGRP